jgi:quinolinate synthase
MLYLIIHPESDYEMFSDGDMDSCTKALERHIIEADSSDDAIKKYIEYNEGKLRSENINNYFVLQVASKKCEVASKGLISGIRDKEQKEKNDKTITKELAELARLKKKFEGA